ncbi:MAG: hypothetical protein K2I76_02965, partial [Malacoplasma sp.]|nr:hypothetical protein [Malacoplasma sp.]
MNKYKNQIGLIGLNDFGVCLLRNLTRNCFSVANYDYKKRNYENLKKEGFTCFDSIKEMISNFFGEIIIFLTGNWNEGLENVYFTLIELLPSESIIIDATNCNYDVVQKNYQKAINKNINYLDAALVGTLDDITWFPNLLVSGNLNTFNYLKHIFELLVADKKVFYFEKIGSSHYLKKIHDAIENSFAQSIIEGLSLIKKSNYNFDIKSVTDFFNDSLIESKTMKLIGQSYDKEIKPDGFENSTYELLSNQE